MKCIGDLIPTPKPAKEPKPLTRKQQRLITAAVEIRQSQPSWEDRAYMARQLMQCTLPHRDPGKVEAWERRNGNLTMAIRPGWDTKKQKIVGYPFGSIPRLLLYWITTEAVNKESRRLELGQNLSHFLNELGMNSRNGTTASSDRRRLQEQMERLFRAQITFQQSMDYTGAPQGKRWLNMDVAPVGELWWDPKHPDQGSLWTSWIMLGEQFYEAITQSAVPIDTRALKVLKQSPLQLDLYGWSTYMAFRANRKNQPQKVSWSGLIEQLGCDYNRKRMDHFKTKVKTAMRKVSTVFPNGIKHQWTLEGITFLPGTVLPVPLREPSQLL